MNWLRDCEAECGDISPGLLVYNAALIPTGPFVEMTRDTLEGIARVNVLGPLTLMRALLGPMRRRGRGAVVLMSSLSGIQGWPGIAAYSVEQGVQHRARRSALVRTG